MEKEEQTVSAVAAMVTPTPGQEDKPELEAVDGLAAKVEAKAAEAAAVITEREAWVDPDVQVESLCRWAAARALVLVQLPKVSIPALVANDVYLVQAIAKVHGQNPTVGMVGGFLAGLGGTVITLIAAKIPFRPLQSLVAACMTYALGKVANEWVKEGMPTTDVGAYWPILLEGFDQARVGLGELIANPLGNNGGCPLGDETQERFVKIADSVLCNLETLQSKVFEFFESAGEGKASGECPLGGMAKGAVAGVTGLVGLLATKKLLQSDNVGDVVDKAKTTLTTFTSLVTDALETVPSTWPTHSLKIPDGLEGKEAVNAAVDAVKDRLGCK